MDLDDYSCTDALIDGVGPKEKLLCDLHLNSALNIDHILHNNNFPLRYRIYEDEKYAKSIKRITSCMRELKVKSIDKYTPGSIPVKVRASTPCNILVCPNDEVCYEILDHLLTSMEQTTLPIRRKDLLSACQSKCVPSRLLGNFNRLMKSCCQVAEILRGGSSRLWDDVNVIDKTVHGYLNGGLDSILYLTDGTVVIYVYKDQGYMTTWEDLLALLDTLGQRICYYLANNICGGGQENGVISIESIPAILSPFDRLLDILGNCGYKVISIFEAMVVGVILSKSPDHITDHNGFLNSVEKEILEMFPEFPEITHDIINMRCTGLDDLRNIVNTVVSDIISLLQCFSTTQLSNIFCIYRIWGHPYVDVYSGLEKVHSIGTKNKHIDRQLPNTALFIFRESILRGYYDKSGVYPAHHVVIEKNPPQDSYILQQLEDNSPIHRNHPGYRLYDMEYILLDQMYTVPQTYDLTHILNDKAVSPTKSEMVAQVMSGQSLEGMEGRRGVIRWLENDTVKAADFLDNIDKQGLDDDSLIIGMYEKEREMKNAARMFALMSEKMRYYFVLTEEMIAEHILPYFPQITMKDSLNKLQKKLWTAGSNYRKHSEDVNINIDFSKWNTNMRGELMTPLFSEMDRMFGYRNVISRTHSIFYASLIYSSSGKYMPCISESGLLKEEPPMCYSGHQGGMEGLRQKGWTVGTVCLIEDVARHLKVEYKLMGQGDNQIIKLLMSVILWKNAGLTDSEIRMQAQDRVTSFVAHLENTFSMVGLPIKPRECWQSARLFMYGKVMLLDDAVLPQWCKKLLRSYALSNEGVLTIAGTIGTISTNCMAASSSMVYVDQAYSIYIMLGCWTLSFLLDYHPFSRDRSLCDKVIQFMASDKSPHKAPALSRIHLSFIILCVPAVCSGSVNIPFTSYVVRGFPDPAAEGYSFLNTLTQGPNATLNRIANNFVDYIPPRSIQLERLIESPLSINHVKVRTPTLAAREESGQYILDRYRNKNKVVKLYGMLQEQFTKTLKIEDVITDPVNPLVMNEIYQLSPDVIISDLISRVQMTRTLKKLTVKDAGVDLIKKIQKAEGEFIGFLRWRGKQQGVRYSCCITEHVRKMRNIGWGREITGVTTPHPIELFKRVSICERPVTCKKTTDYVYVKRAEKKFSPYLGSSVKSKVSSSQDAMLRREPILKQASRIYKLAIWMGLGENYLSVIKALTQLYIPSSCQNEIMKDLLKDVKDGGAIDHRLNNAQTSGGCFINYAPQVGTSIFMSSDDMLKYGRGNTNYTLQYQAIYGYIQYTSAHRIDLSSMHWHIECCQCVVPVSDVIPDLTASNCITIHENISNALKEMFPIDIEKIYRIREQNKQYTYDFVPNVRFCNVTKQAMRVSCAIMLAGKIAIGLMSGGKAISAHQVDLEDLQYFPRIYTYKVYTDEILLYTSHLLILYICSQRQLSYDHSGIYKAKKILRDRLMHATNEDMSPLACITLSQITSVDKLHIWGKGNIYPETVQEKCAMANAALRRTLDDIIQPGQCAFPSKLILSCSTVSQLEGNLILCLGALCQRKKKSTREIIEYLQNTDSEIPKDLVTYSRKHVELIGEDIDVCMKSISTIRERSVVEKKVDIMSINQPPYIAIPLYENAFTCKHVNTGQLINYSDVSWQHRIITLPTAAAYKWTEVMRFVKPSEHCIVLGDGTGTTSYIIATSYPDTTVYPTALIEYDNLTPQDLSSMYPAMSRNLKNIKHDVIKYCTDNVNDKFWSLDIHSFISYHTSYNVTIVSDIEAGGGSILKLMMLSDLIRFQCPVVCKIYIRELISDPSVPDLKLTDGYLLIPRTCNHRLGEAFLYICPGSRGLFPGLPDICYGYGDLQKTITLDSIIETMRKIEHLHPNLIENSVVLFLREIEKLGFPLTREFLLLPRVEVLMSLLAYVNTHYHYKSQQKIGNYARSITLRRRECLETLFCIFLGATTDPIDEDKDMYESGIKILHREAGINKKYRYTVFPSVIMGQHRKLNNKQVQLLTFLRNFRIVNRVCRVKTHQPVPLEVPSDHRDNYLGFLSDYSPGWEGYYTSSSLSSYGDHVSEDHLE